MGLPGGDMMMRSSDRDPKYGGSMVKSIVTMLFEVWKKMLFNRAKAQEYKKLLNTRSSLVP